MTHFYRQKKIFILVLFTFFVSSSSLFSQDLEKEKFLYGSEWDEFVFPDTPFVEEKPLMPNPYFLPVVFDGKYTDDLSIFLPEIVEKKEQILPSALQMPPLFEEIKIREKIRKKGYRDLLRYRVDLVKFSYLDFSGEIEKIEEIKPNIFQSLFNPKLEFENNTIDQSARFVPKRLYWVISGSHLLQFSQNYLSDNWYKGGVGNLNLLSVQSFTANYKKGKVQFNNFLEWKLSFYTNPNDTLRNSRIGEDAIRSYSDFGIKAFNNWLYSSNLEIKTQFFKNYKENSPEYVSALLAPLQVNLGVLGMKYQLNKKYKRDKYKKLDLSVDISPFSVQYTKIFDKKVAPKRFGIEEGESSILDLGSTMNAKLVMNVNRQFSFSSRIKYFSNYEKVSIEAENELNMSITNHFSTRLYVFARFDDSPGIVKDKDLGYFQINEMIRFGFNYKW